MSSTAGGPASCASSSPIPSTRGAPRSAAASWMSSSSPSSRNAKLIVRNRSALRSEYPPELRGQYDEPQHNAAWLAVRRLPGYRATFLHELPALAAALGLGRLWIKDESDRFDLGAFKSTGGAYAVYRVIREKLHGSGERVSVDNLLAGRLKALTSGITVACASAGNHGRAVAWAAQIFGIRCVVYLYQDVSPARVRAIQELGATVVTTPPDYDHAVQQVAAHAAREGWDIVSDTAYPGYHAIPLMVMDGYSVIAQEALNQLMDVRPTHVLLQAGVGSFAAAMASHIWLREKAQRPTFITVEPDGAACVLKSIEAGAPTTLPEVHSIMGGLCCGVMSEVAWDVLRRAADW